MRSLDLSVGPSDAGARLDQFIARAGGISRGAARRALEAGGVFVERARVKIASRKVWPGQRVVVNLDEGGRPAPRADQPLEPERVLYRDADLLVVDKPAGVPAQATLTSDHDTLPLRAAALLAALSGGPAPWVGSVHRLDRMTSGVCALALSPRAQRELMRAFREGRVEKEYLALCAGRAPESAVVEAPLERDPARPGLMRIVARGGIPARTRVALREALAGASLVACFPETGRTHQIRVHLASIGHPLLGDRRYGGPGEVALPGGGRGPVPRPMLHAARLVLPPAIEVRAAPPEDFRELMRALGAAGLPQPKERAAPRPR